MLIWLCVNNYVCTIYYNRCFWVTADLDRPNNYCIICFACYHSLFLTSFMCSCFFINDEWNQHVQPSHLTIISAVRWLWKMWYLCRNDKWMCVNSSCGLVIWWMWWWVMNGCHGKLQIEIIVTNNLNTNTFVNSCGFFVHELMMHHQHTRKRYTWHSSEWWWLLDYYAVCSEMIGVLNWDLINDQKRLLHFRISIT